MEIEFYLFISQVIGSVIAFLMIVAAYWATIWQFIKRI